MEIVDGTILKTKMAIKGHGLFVDGMNQNRSRCNFFGSAPTSL